MVAEATQCSRSGTASGPELIEEIRPRRRFPGVIEHEAEIRAELGIVPDLWIVSHGQLPLFDGVAAPVLSVVEDAKRELEATPPSGF